LANTSFPKIASLARAVVRFLRLAVSVPPWSPITSSIGFNLGGVLKGGGGILMLGVGEGFGVKDQDFCSALEDLAVDSHSDDDKRTSLPLLSLGNSHELR